MTNKNPKRGENATRILIIEDDVDDSTLLMRQLEKAKLAHHVRVIADGKEAWEYLVESAESENNLVAIFLDLKLPSLSGLHLLEKIRLDRKMQHLPVIVMTSSNSVEDIVHCQRLGVTSYVQKPITFTTFSKAVADNFHSQISQTDSLTLSLGTE